jgi:hypothetical protein
MFTFLIGQAFLSILCAMKWGTFLFFAGWVVIMTIFVILCVPETKVWERFATRYPKSIPFWIVHTLISGQAQQL